MNQSPGRAPGHDCPVCPRLVQFRQAIRTKQPNWHNAPVPSFGHDDARLLIVGLAPGLKGANRTGRPFTGDYAGDLLYATLKDFGWARGEYGREPDDGFELNATSRKADDYFTWLFRLRPPDHVAQVEDVSSRDVESQVRLRGEGDRRM